MTTLIAIDWAVVGIKAGQLIVCLAILVVLHEMGHFLTAKWFKCRIEKFYLFFDPGFSLVKKKIGETVFGIGWLPLGGYVKISGMVDESMDNEQMKHPPQPWEFRSKKPWQRLIVMLGGVMVNLILGFFLFGMTLWVWGEDYLPVKNVDGVYVDSLGKSIGLKDGDKIVAVNGKEIEDFNGLIFDIILNEAKSIQIIRDTQQLDLPITDRTIGQLVSLQGDMLAYPKFPAVVDSISQDAQFTSGRLLKDDQIIGFNSQAVGCFFELRDLKKGYRNKDVALTVVRNKRDTVRVGVKLAADGNLGFYYRQVDKFLKYAKRKYTFLEALPAGVVKGWRLLVAYVQSFKLLFTNKEVKARESLGGLLTIGNMFDAEWNWEHFWLMTAILSIILAFMNILPIPALDGGHVLFILYEMITGRKLSDKFMEYAQMAGMVLLLGLLVFVLGLDLWRYLFKP